MRAQVTFTLGKQYIPIETGLIPLDSVRVGKGVFLSTTDMTTHPCAMYSELDGYMAFPSKKSFDDRFPNATASPPRQMCAPNAAMCVSPTSIPDHFVSFNIPLGIDWLPVVAAENMESLSNNVFVHLVVSAKDRGLSPHPPPRWALPRVPRHRLTKKNVLELATDARVGIAALQTRSECRSPTTARRRSR